MLIGLGIGALVVILVVVGGVVFKQQQERRAAEAHAAEKSRRAGTAGATVQQYFAALSSGNASQVLGMVSNAPDDGALLDDKTLAESRKVGPIAGVEIAPATVDDSLQTAMVDASYQVGTEPQTYQFALTANGDGWVIDNGLSSLELVSNGPIVINGQRVESGSQPAFIGGYQVSTGTARTTYADNKIIAGTPDGTSWSGEPTLTDDGKKYVKDQAKRALDKCTAAKELQPKDCPFAVQASSSQKLNRNSISWTITNDPMKDADITYTADSALLRAPVHWEFKASGTCSGKSCSFVQEDKPTSTFRLAGVSGSQSRGAWYPF